MTSKMKAYDVDGAVFAAGDMVKMTSNVPAHGDDITGLVGKVIGRRDRYWGVEFDHVTDYIAQDNPYLVLQSEMEHFFLRDPADLPPGLAEGQVEAGGDLVAVKWKFGDSDEKMAELVRVAEMEGAHVTATRYGATRSGNVHHVERSVRIHLGIFSGEVVIDLRLGGWTLTVTAPKPVGPGADIPDEVVEAAVEAATRERDSGRSVAYSDTMRLALAAADAKRAELAGQA